MIPKAVRADAAKATVSFDLREAVEPGTQTVSNDVRFGCPIAVQICRVFGNQCSQLEDVGSGARTSAGGAADRGTSSQSKTAMADRAAGARSGACSLSRRVTSLKSSPRLSMARRRGHPHDTS